MPPSTLTRIALFAACVAAVVSVVVILHQHRQIQALQAQAAAAQPQAAESTRLQAEVDRLRALEAEAQTLRQQNRDLPRLRGDLARLRQELAAATNRSSATAVNRSVETTPAPASQTNFATFTGTARASLASGQTLVMGGWPLEPGKRTLALFTPETGEGGKPDGILIRGLYVQVPESALAGPGWEQFQAVTKDANSSGVFDTDHAKALVEALRKLPGVEILSQPRLSTGSGVTGTIFVGEENGASVITTLSPVLSPDSQSIDLTVSNALRRLVAPSGS